MITSRKIEPTKKMQMRITTELVVLTTACSGSSDSTAAIVATSAPTMEKTTTTMPENIAQGPVGRNPPRLVRLEKSMAWPGQRPRTKQRPRARKMQIAATLIRANRYSNSP